MKGRRSCLRPSGIFTLLIFPANACAVKLTAEALAGKKSKLKKKVRFAQNVVQPRCNNKDYRRRRKRIVATMMSSSEENRTSEMYMSTW